MIPTGDLMIGNYVKHTLKSNVDIDPYSKADHGVSVILSLNYKVKSVKVNPIPITEEWLLKFGFEILPYKISNSIVYEKNNVRVFVKDGRYLLSKNGLQSLYLTELEYVHELQNSYYWLKEKLTLY